MASRMRSAGWTTVTARRRSDARIIEPTRLDMMRPPTQPATTDALVVRLRTLDVCAVSDALDHFGLEGVLDGVGPLWAPLRVAGRVITVQLGPPDEHPARRHLCSEAVAAAGPGDVIVVDHQARTDCAGWGGNLSRAAMQRGVAGTIVHGAVRDVDESRDIGYPVFAAATTPRTARGRTREHAWGAEIRLGELRVTTGDFVIADGTGVAFITASDAERVVDRAETIAAKEAEMAKAIDSGTSATEVMGRSYETMIGGDS